MHTYYYNIKCKDYDVMMTYAILYFASVHQFFHTKLKETAKDQMVFVLVCIPFCCFYIL